MTVTILWILVSLLVLAGLAGVVLPALPGTPFIFLGLLLAAWIDDFAKVSGLVIALLGVLAALAWLVDVAATSLGAKRVGASTIAIVGAAVGTIVGLFFGIPGIVFGPLLGAIVGELIATRDSRQAARAGLGTWIGLIVALAAKVSLAFSMIGLFAAAYFVG